MKSIFNEIEAVLKSLGRDGLKPDQHIFLAENFNQFTMHSKELDARDRSPWRMDALSDWVRLPKKLKIIKILRKQNVDACLKALEASPQATEVVATMATPEGVLGLNCFDEVVTRWDNGPGATILYHLFSAPEFDHGNVALYKKAVKTLEREQLSPGKGKARYLSDGKILFDRPIAGRTNYYAKGAAEKIKAGTVNN